MKQLSKLEARLYQACSVVALTYSVIFQYLIVKAYLSGDFMITLDFHAAGEGYLEMLVVFPACLIISVFSFYHSRKLG